MKTYRIKHVAEYALLRLLAGLLRRLPYRAALLLGWLLAGVAYRVVRFRVAEARRRIRTVLGPGLAPRAVDRIAWRSLRNFVFTAVEVCRGPRVSAAWLRAVVDYEDAYQAIRRALRPDRGAILACPHMGSWELAGITSQVLGLPIFSIAAEQKNPLVNAYLNRLRAGPRTEILQRGAGAMKSVIRRLRSGHLLAILPDVRQRTPGVTVRVFGGEANVGPGMALFARHANVPILVAILTRRGWSRHTFRIPATVWPDPQSDKQADVQRMTQTVMDRVDQAVRAQPDQWFWFNRRWLLDPLDER